MKQEDKTPKVTTKLDSELYRHMMNIVSFLSKRKSVNILIGRGEESRWLLSTLEQIDGGGGGGGGGGWVIIIATRSKIILWKTWKKFTKMLKVKDYHIDFILNLDTKFCDRRLYEIDCRL